MSLSFQPEKTDKLYRSGLNILLTVLFFGIPEKMIVPEKTPIKKTSKIWWKKNIKQDCYRNLLSASTNIIICR